MNDGHMNILCIPKKETGFTLIEVLAAMAIFLILMIAIVRIFIEASGAAEKANTSAARNATSRVALEMIRDDLQGAIIDQKLALHKEADTTENNFDRICFITMRQDTQDTSATNDYVCLEVQYAVNQVVVTNSSVVYTNWVLKRGTRSLETSIKLGTDPFSNTGKKWWKNQDPLSFDWTEIADNVIRFDIWVCSEAGENLTSGESNFGGVSPFDSITGAPGAGIQANTPPGYIDIYLQVTSDEAMKRGALAKAAGQSDAAYAIFYRDANVLVSRITPMMWAAERIHPLSY